MSIAGLISQLYSRGIKLFIDGDYLGYEAPEGALTPELRGELIEHKQRILAFLRAAKLSSRSGSPSILPVSRDAELPMSFSQQRLWFLDQLMPDLPIYNIPNAMRLSGPLDVVAFEQALREIVRRHEVLRTAFTDVDGQPVQVISEDISFTLPVVDLGRLPETEREAETIRSAEKEAQQPFDLEQGPLLSVRFLRLAEEDHVVLLTMHHIISDGWSMGIFARELSALHEAFSTGKPSPLPELQIQYADFAVWQREWLQGDVLDTQLSYWKEQLDGAPPLLEMPSDHPRPPVETYSGTTEFMSLPPTLTEALKALSRAEGTTLFMTLLAAFKTLLHRYTGQEDIVVGSPIANRNRIETEELIGFFVNTLVLRTDLSGNPTFGELLSRVSEMCLAAYDHQDLPFEKLVEEMQPERNLSYSPLFQVMFILHNAPGSPLELSDLTLTPVPVETRTTLFDLTLITVDEPEGLQISLEYSTDLFEATTVRRMLRHFQTLLHSVVTDPEQRISDLPILTELERSQLLVEWNDTQTSYPESLCVHELFEAQVEHTPDAIAVVFGDEQLTYQELNHRANQLAHHLQALEVGPETLVSILMERSLEMVVAELGTLKAGGAYMPLDPAYPGERVAFMLEDSQASVLLTQENLLTGLPDQGTHIVCLDRDWERIAQKSAENPANSGKTDDLAYVIYTSGSTGRPKGVLIPHRGLLNLIFWHQRAFAVTRSDQATQLAGVAFDASVWEIWPYLTIGATLHLIEPESIGSPERIKDWLVSKEITISFLPTPLAEVVLSLEWPENVALRIMLTGGDKLHNYPPASLPFKLVNNYGPTENTVVTTSGIVDSGVQNDMLPPIGHPIDNVQIYVLDRHLQPVAVGVPGELYIGGSGLARGYLNRPELTAEKFIPHPFSDDPEARLYKTGDLVHYLPDGNMEFLTRLDHQVKLRGFRIELGEIETVLDQHPDIRESAVTLREDMPGGKHLAAYVVMAKERELDANELRSFLRKKLPEYMIPSRFVLMDAFPLTPNGKIDLRALPAPDHERSAVKHTPPQTETQRKIASIWSEILELEDVGLNDSFFDLGGHSLLAVRMFSQIQKIFGKNLPLSILFQFPTIEQLAEAVCREEELTAKSSLMVAFQEGDDSRRPFFGIHACMGEVLSFRHLVAHLGKDQPFYAIRARGLYGETHPHTRYEEMAACYVKAIQAVQPRGPYILCGAGAGGWLVMETAQHLLASGQGVELLFLFDALYPDANGRMGLEADIFERHRTPMSDPALSGDARGPKKGSIDWYTERFIYHFRKGDLGSMTFRAVIRGFRERFFWRLLAYSFIPRRIGFIRDRMDYVHRVRVLFGREFWKYVPRPYPGRIIYFLSRERRGHFNSKWYELAQGGIDVYDMPSEHHNILQEPYVQLLAEKVRYHLDQAHADYLSLPKD